MKKTAITFLIYLLLYVGLIFLINFLVSEKPIEFALHSFGDFFKHFFDNFLFVPLAYLLQRFSRVHNNCLIGIFIFSLIIKIIEDSINQVQKTNLVKMEMVQAEIEKIEKKYAEMEAEEVKDKKSIEKMFVYKKYGIKPRRVWLSFFPLVIQIVIYTLFLRFSLYGGENDRMNWVAGLNTTVFGVDLFARATTGNMQMIAMIAIVLLEILLRVALSFHDIFIKPKKEHENMHYSNLAMLIAISVWIFLGNVAFGIYFLIGDLFLLNKKLIQWIKMRRKTRV